MCKWRDKHINLVIKAESYISSQNSWKMEKRGYDYNYLQVLIRTEHC
jgi:hypothetical protein